MLSKVNLFRLWNGIKIPNKKWKVNSIRTPSYFSKENANFFPKNKNKIFFPKSFHSRNILRQEAQETTSSSKENNPLDIKVPPPEQPFQNFDPTGWWMTEKVEGIRVYWDGSTFWTRSWNPITAPEEIVKKMPPLQMDGMLSYGKGIQAFYKASRLIQEKQLGMEAWEGLRFFVFDAPKENKPLEERYEILKKTISEDHPFLFLVPLQTCNGLDHLKQYIQEILRKGGVAAILRKPQSLYEPGRSPTLLEVKPLPDEEAKVIGYTDDGLLKCILANGKEVTVYVKEMNQ